MEIEKRTLIEFKELLQFDLIQTQNIIDEFCENKKVDEYGIESPELLLELLKKIIKKEYEILLYFKGGQYEMYNCFLFIELDSREKIPVIYEMTLYECSCGWGYCIGKFLRKKDTLDTLLRETLNIYKLLIKGN